MRSSAMSARLALLAVLTTGVIAHAQDDAARCACLIHRLHNEGTPPPGKPRDIPHTDERGRLAVRWPNTCSQARHRAASATTSGAEYPSAMASLAGVTRVPGAGTRPAVTSCAIATSWDGPTVAGSRAALERMPLMVRLFPITSTASPAA